MTLPRAGPLGTLVPCLFLAFLLPVCAAVDCSLLSAFCFLYAPRLDAQLVQHCLDCNTRQLSLVHAEIAPWPGIDSLAAAGNIDLAHP